MEIIKQRLRKLRGEKSQAQIEIQTGVGQRTISRWENTPPENLESLIALAEYYKVSTDYLLGLTDDPRPVSNPTTPQHITEEQAATLEALMNLSPDDQKVVGQMIQFLKDRQK